MGGIKERVRGRPGGTWGAHLRWAGALLLAGLLPCVQAQEVEPVDSMAWRVKACSACHGDRGRATPEGYFPRLAGKPADYLFRQMQNFRDGRRSHTQMRYLMAHLSDDYLREIAGYFAQREVPYPPPLGAQASAPVLAQGRALVMQGDATRALPACVACHGPAMTGVLPAVPGLLGLSRDYLNSQLGAWRTGARRAQSPDCMSEIARKLSVHEVGAISAWLAAQPVPLGGNALGGKPLAQQPAPAPMACAGLEAAPPAAGATAREKP